MSELAGTPDPGLQAERTALAWVRSCLALLVAAVALSRLVAYVNGVVAAVIAVGCIPLAVLVGVLAGARYRRSVRRFRLSRPVGDGLLPGAATLLVVLLGLAGLGYVLLG
ncbi:uncharacterized membrane protein YidH (DUF202 family) [Tamaricihabitans halophyticus]|uniref:Uncharacterized membrane protein YidH (DUF202 family) n=1 Tax=Tamaricihabitans halophyticus TaxID=1262583 RepID=A0A4R2QEG2_9PSEU|nr:DUF202 domain-containing protein [Tamaricihabitans halophyticus]TCP46854.1 uncharacterized membrane protein YidH (DUF202 family) [Tamaricihabitans halophyticus]